MRCLIRRRAADGSWSERQVDAPHVTLGRGTPCTVQLTGLMVALEHARLQLAGPARYQLESEALTGVEVDGATGVRSAEVRPGSVLRIAEHEVAIGNPASGADLVLTVTALPQEDATRAPISLEAAGLRTRRLAWLGVLLVLAVALVLPLVLRGAGVHVPLLSDAAWSPGPISDAHASFGGDCGRCHRQLLHRVDAAVCRDCHAEPHGHSKDAAVQGRLDDAGCTSCHREHKGNRGLVLRTSALCADCHRDPAAFTQVAALPPASDFGRDHPEFTPGVERGAASASPPESGLIFSHESHLRADGVRGPAGDEKLACGSCHAPGAGRVAYGMPTYEANCQRCHRLSVVIDNKDTDLPHGQSEGALKLIAVGVASSPLPEAAPDAGMRQRAGATAERTPESAPADFAGDTFDRLCGGCHQVERRDGVARVKPPSLVKTWFTAARFTHARHEAVRCEDCHAASASARAEDVLMPRLENCRGCHDGDHARNRVPSDCASCHEFHRLGPAAAPTPTPPAAKAAS